MHGVVHKKCCNCANLNRFVSEISPCITNERFLQNFLSLSFYLILIEFAVIVLYVDIKIAVIPYA